MSLHEYRNAKTLVLTPDATAYEAARAMAERQVGSVVVVDHGRLAGIVTDRDLMLDIVVQARDPQATRLRAIMKQDVATIDVEGTIDDAVTMMRTNACRRLPIIDDGVIVGMITLDDLLLDRALGADAISSVLGSQLELAASWSERNRQREGEPKEANILGRHLRLRRRHQSHADATYTRLIHEVERATGLKSRQEAETGLLIALEGICRRIAPTEATHLLAQLPSIVREALMPSIEGPDKKITTEMIEAELRIQLHLDEMDARDVLLAICGVIADKISSGLTSSLRANLPTEMKGLFGPEVASPIHSRP